MVDNHYSPTIIITLYRIFVEINQFSSNTISASALVSIIENSGIFSGSGETVPIREALKLGQYHNFFKIHNGDILLPELLEVDLLPHCVEIAPNYLAIRKILFKIIQDNKFHWLLYFNDDIDTFRILIPDTWEEILDLGDLFNFENDNVINWWKRIFEFIHEYDNEQLKNIGDIGEMLTFEFEKSRLNDDGVKNTDPYIQWVSRINDKLGYDIHSIRSNLLQHSLNPMERIQIEVKSSSLANAKQFRFFISRNEWNTAIENIDSYYFYCWLGIDLTKKEAKEGPIIVPAKSIAGLFPPDTNNIITWSECRVNIDLMIYKN